MTETCIDHGFAGSKGGYANIRYVVGGFKKHTGRHVHAFYMANGYFPTVVRHTCNNGRCINPKHLVDGEYCDNNRDTVAAGNHPLAKFSQEVVDRIRTEYATGKHTQKEVAAKYGTCPAYVSRVCSYSIRKPPDML